MVDDAMTAAAKSAAERTRAMAGDGPGPIVPGSEGHKTLFCRMLLDTHDPYKPSVIEWPQLDPPARERLIALPIWDIAVQTEGRARTNVVSYAATIADPLVRQAVELDGFEEGRHKQVLSDLVAAYGIALADEPPYPPPRDPERAFLVTGFSECIDSFFAFGLFALSQRSGFFPQPLVATFEPVMQEEGRHILFFINWVAWHRRKLSPWRRLVFEAKILGVWGFLIWERIGIARGIGGEGAAADNNFTVTGSRAVSNVDLSLGSLIDICLAENDRRLSLYDPRLLRPRAVPCAMRLVRRVMRAPIWRWGRRR